MSCPVIAYTYEADVHCEPDAAERFGYSSPGHVGEGAEDDEGNEPGVILAWDSPVAEWGSVHACGTCGHTICMGCGEVDQDRKDGDECWNCGQEWEVTE